MSDIEREAFERIERHFNSGNTVKVEQSVIKRADWILAKGHIKACRQALSSCSEFPNSCDQAVSVPGDEYIRALQDAFDIIQADANTEENYASLCRIGSVLAKFNATPTKADTWIKCSERLPEESDGDCHGIVWVYDEALLKVEISDSVDVKFISDYTHWMPTNLVRPEPPKEQYDDQ